MRLFLYILFTFLSIVASSQTAHDIELQGGALGGDMDATLFRLYYVQEWPQKKIVIRVGPSLFAEHGENTRRYWGAVGGVGRVWRKKALTIQLGALAGIDKNCWQYGPFLQVGAGVGKIDLKLEGNAGFFWDDGAMTFYSVLLCVNYNFLAR